jgi:hypothetical protein
VSFIVIANVDDTCTTAGFANDLFRKSIFLEIMKSILSLTLFIERKNHFICSNHLFDSYVNISLFIVDLNGNALTMNNNPGWVSLFFLPYFLIDFLCLEMIMLCVHQLGMLLVQPFVKCKILKLGNYVK